MASGSQSLSNEQMRRTWAMLDILTSFKRRTNRPPPTAELIRRKFDDISLPALDTLSILVDHTVLLKSNTVDLARARLAAWHEP